VLARDRAIDFGIVDEGQIVPGATALRCDARRSYARCWCGVCSTQSTTISRAARALPSQIPRALPAGVRFRSTQTPRRRPEAAESCAAQPENPAGTGSSIVRELSVSPPPGIGPEVALKRARLIRRDTVRLHQDTLAYADVGKHPKEPVHVTHIDPAAVAFTVSCDP
jgi:hypothetical protein